MTKKISEKAMLMILERLGLFPEDHGEYFRIVCPSCGHKEAFAYKNTSLIACSRKNKCNFMKSVLELAKEENILKKELYKEIGQDLSKKETIKENTVLEIPDGLTFFGEGNENGLIYKKALSYLKSRKIPDKEINRLGYVYCPDRTISLGVFIPFFENEELVYYIIRNTDTESDFRYDNPKDIKSNNFVYNYDNFIEEDTVCITEGIFDAISIENFTGTAMLKSSLSPSQASKIFDKAPKRIIYIPDNDKAGRGFLKKNMEILIRYKPPSIETEFLIFNIPDPFKDFNQYSISNGGFIDLNKCDRYSDFKRSFLFKRKTPL